MRDAGWVTAVLLALAVALLALPGLRDALLFTGATMAPEFTPFRPSGVSMEKVVLAHAQDPMMWIAYAEVGPQATKPEYDTPWLRYIEQLGWPGFLRQPGKATPQEAISRAERLGPDTPAVVARCAMWELSWAGPLDRPDLDVRPGEPAMPPYPPRTADENAHLRKAIALLERWGKLDPGNAAPDYLLARTAFGQKQDAEAIDYLARALRKTGWDVYGPQSAEAAERLYAGMPITRLCPWGFAEEYQNASFLGEHLRHTARYAAWLGDRYRERGDDARALALYESAMHLGHLLRVRGYTLIDPLVGMAISEVAIGSVGWEPGRRWPAGREGWRQEHKWRARKLAEYASQHGRADLHAFYDKDMAEAFRWQDDIHHAVDAENAAALGRWGGMPMGAVGVWGLAGTLVVLWAIVTLVAWRKPSDEAPVNWWAWAGLLAVTTAIAFLGAMAAERGVVATAQSEGASNYMLPPFCTP